MAELHARYPNALESVSRARRVIGDFCRSWFEAADLADIECAVGEALANAAEHGHADATDIDVYCRYDEAGLTIEIKDGGRGFERWSSRDYVRPATSAPRGYGTCIMRELMDSVEYSENGTRLRLHKRRVAASGFEYARHARHG